MNGPRPEWRIPRSQHNAPCLNRNLGLDFWLAVNLSLALVIVGISGYLKVRGRPAVATPPTPSAVLE